MKQRSRYEGEVAEDLCFKEEEGWLQWKLKKNKGRVVGERICFFM
jgi:hypothetical protein